MVRSQDEVITVKVLSSGAPGGHRLLSALDRPAPKVGKEVLCAGSDGRCVAAPGRVIKRSDKSTFLIEG